jgi:hypothetical protein
MYQQDFSALPETIAGGYDNADNVPTNRYLAPQNIVLKRFTNPTKFSFTYWVKFRML